MATSAPRRSAEQSRAAVLAAAVPEFAVGGLAGTSTESIARRAGISQPYLFRLFATKKDLFLASTARVFGLIAAAFEEAAEGKTGQEALDAMSWAYHDQFLNDRMLLMHQLQAYSNCDDQDVQRVTREGFGRLWELVERLSGATTEQTQSFFAMGMLLNVAAAMNLGNYDVAWAAECLSPQQLPD